jgi:hypothetical protein
MLYRFDIIQKVRFKDIQGNNPLNFILQLSLANGHYYSLIISKTNWSLTLPAVSHVPQFGDAASPAGDVDVSAGMCISRGRCGISCGRFARISKFRDM